MKVMTDRKPPTMSFPDWVDAQIRAAEAEGAFANLPGAGKPIPDLDRSQDDLAWVANYLRRENVDVAEILPPALALAKEVERLDQRLQAARSETQARRLVEDLNERIDEAYARPQVGPPLRVKRVKVEEALERWRATRPAPPPPAPPPVPVRPRRRWFRR
jgi:Domain of unknown function (DUF1992)